MTTMDWITAAQKHADSATERVGRAGATDLPTAMAATQDLPTALAALRAVLALADHWAEQGQHEDETPAHALLCADHAEDLRRVIAGAIST